MPGPQTTYSHQTVCWESCFWRYTKTPRERGGAILRKLTRTASSWELNWRWPICPFDSIAEVAEAEYLLRECNSFAGSSSKSLRHRAHLHFDDARSGRLRAGQEHHASHIF